MVKVCAWCGAALGNVSGGPGSDRLVTHGICRRCADRLTESSRSALPEFLATLGAPVLAVDGDGVALAASPEACGLLGKGPEGVLERLGGDIIECVYSRLPEGCGNSEHCRTGCIIRRSVGRTRATGRGVSRLQAVQTVSSPEGERQLRLLITTEQLGEVTLLKIEEAGFA